MAIPNDIEELTELFRRLGADSPEAWASSQIEEGIEQLHRFLFLRQAWKQVISEADSDWYKREQANSQKSPDGPYAGIGQAVNRCLGKGVDPKDLTDIVRGMQAQLLFNLCYLLEDPMLEEDELEGVGWCLVKSNHECEPTQTRIPGLHESVLEMEPMGREMRPRTTP